MNNRTHTIPSGPRLLSLGAVLTPLLALTSACESPSAPLSFEGSSVALTEAIDGTAFFPPFAAADPVPSGPFDPSLLPRLRVAVLHAGVEVASLSASNGLVLWADRGMYAVGLPDTENADSPEVVVYLEEAQLARSTIPRKPDLTHYANLTMRFRVEAREVPVVDDVTFSGGTVVITGRNFARDTIALIGDVRGTTARWMSAQRLEVAMPAGFAQDVRALDVVVYTPEPGGGTFTRSGAHPLPTLAWAPVAEGALPGATPGSWRSGHVTQLLDLGGGQRLVGTRTGGVWLLDAGQTTPLSNDWDGPDVRALALGPDGPHHIFAITGTPRSRPRVTTDGAWVDPMTSPSLLYESDVSAPQPLHRWSPVSDLPAGCDPTQVLATPNDRHLVLACSTGLYWADIPVSARAPRSYTWRRAELAGEGPGVQSVPFSAVALGPVSAAGGDTIVAVRSSASSALSEAFPAYVGDWASGSLVLRGAQALPLTALTSPGHGGVALASCASDRRIVYANVLLCGASSSSCDEGYALRSSDGGQTWGVLPQSYLQTSSPSIAVGPTAGCDRVALVTSAGVLRMSNDGGQRWVDRAAPASETLVFESSDAAARTIHLGGLDGVATTTDLGLTFDTRANEHLGTLEYVRHAPSFGWAAPSVGALPFDVPTRQFHRDQCAEDSAVFSTPISPTLFRTIAAPAQRNACGQLLYALAVADRRMYGLFADAWGTRAHWEYLSDPPPSSGTVAALESYDGKDVFGGIWASEAVAELFHIDGRTGQRVAMPLPGAFSRVTRIVPSQGGSAYAIAYSPGSEESLLHWDGSSWQRLAFPAGQRPLDVVVDDTASPRGVYVATDTGVSRSLDGGATWHDVSTQLPRRPHGRQLNLHQEGAATYLDLATHGRSTFRALLH